jgi:hypothetical protein
MEYYTDIKIGLEEDNAWHSSSYKYLKQEVERRNAEHPTRGCSKSSLQRKADLCLVQCCSRGVFFL